MAFVTSLCKRRASESANGSESLLGFVDLVVEKPNEGMESLLGFVNSVVERPNEVAESLLGFVDSVVERPNEGARLRLGSVDSVIEQPSEGAESLLGCVDSVVERPNEGAEASDDGMEETSTFGKTVLTSRVTVDWSIVGRVMLVAGKFMPSVMVDAWSPDCNAGEPMLALPSRVESAVERLDLDTKSSKKDTASTDDDTPISYAGVVTLALSDAMLAPKLPMPSARSLVTVA